MNAEKTTTILSLLIAPESLISKLNAFYTCMFYVNLGVILSMKTQAEKKLAKEKGLRQAAEAELVKFREYCTAQEREIEALQLLLTQNQIQFKKMDKPSLPVSTIDVVAEVNQYIEAAKMASSGSESPS